MISEIYLDFITKKWHIAKISGIIQIKISDSLFSSLYIGLTSSKTWKKFPSIFTQKGSITMLKTNRNDFLL